MKTTTLRILFTLAILAGLAAAPSAQTFHWQAGRTDAAEQAQRAIDRALRNAQRTIERAQINAQREAERATRNAQLRADRVYREVERNVSAQVRAQVRQQVRVTNRGYYYSPRSFRAVTGYSDLQDFGSDPCRNRNYGRDREDFCEVRDESMAAGPLTVDASPNGGIAIQGWDQNNIRVQAIVHAQADTEARAREIGQQVRVMIGNGRVTAEGPRDLRHEGWSVEYRINVPHKNDLNLSSVNGGISIKNVSGNMKFETSNGGVSLTDVGGAVRGSTSNGGLTVMLSGSRWDGEGLDVRTNNGGVTLAIPENYNAQLEARTVNGGLSANYPLTITGELSTSRGISTTLGSGGPTVRVSTTNGGLKIGRR